jgi:hypothetical protein
VSDLEAEIEDHTTDDEWMKELQEPDEQRIQEMPASPPVTATPTRMLDQEDELASSGGPIPSVSLNLDQNDSADSSIHQNPTLESMHASRTPPPTAQHASVLLAPSPELPTDPDNDTPMANQGLGRDIQRTPSPSGQEGPMTPTNDAGPFVFDGSAGRENENAQVENSEEAT